MNIRAALRTLAAVALVASGPGTGAAHAEQPAPDTQPTIVTEGQTGQGGPASAETCFEVKSPAPKDMLGGQA